MNEVDQDTQAVDPMQAPVAEHQNANSKTVKPLEIVSSQSSLAQPRQARKEPTSKRSRHYVQHEYQDHFFDPAYNPDGEEETKDKVRRGPRGGVAEPFPDRLYKMLQETEREGLEEVVAWQPHGRCFIVHAPKQFADDIMPKHFRQSKFTSFKRQLNLYGFLRLTTHPDRGGYYHPLFLRGRPDLCKKMIRVRVKGSGCKPCSSPATEPKLYTLPYCVEKPQPDVSAPVLSQGPTLLRRVTRDAKDVAVASLTKFQQVGAIPLDAKSFAGKNATDCGTIQSKVSGAFPSLAVALPVAGSERRQVVATKDSFKLGSLATTSDGCQMSLIRELCNDPFLGSLHKGQLPVSKGVKAAANGLHSTLQGDVLRPLPAPYSLFKFQNYKSVPRVLGAAEEASNFDSGPSSTSGDSSWSDTLSNDVQSIASSQEDASLPAKAVLEYRRDPFQDEIKDLIQGLMPQTGDDDTVISIEENGVASRSLYLEPFYLEQ